MKIFSQAHFCLILGTIFCLAAVVAADNNSEDYPTGLDFWNLFNVGKVFWKMSKYSVNNI